MGPAHCQRPSPGSLREQCLPQDNLCARSLGRQSYGYAFIHPMERPCDGKMCYDGRYGDEIWRYSSTKLGIWPDPRLLLHSERYQSMYVRNAVASHSAALVRHIKHEVPTADWHYRFYQGPNAIDRGGEVTSGSAVQ
jgi:hypothetical protein